MASMCVVMTLVLALTLGLALPVAAQQPDLVTGLFGGSPFAEQFCESLLRSLCHRRIVGGEEPGGTNTALGDGAPQNNTTGSDNTAIGADALQSNTTGSNNTAVGFGALSANTTGNNNTAMGSFAGLNVQTGSNNIHIGNGGDAADDALIRIGVAQTATFIAGIRGVTTLNNNAIGVLIDSNGQLGTTSSSRRVKTDIHDLGDQSRALHQLRPVSFRYRSHPPDGAPEYGLIAEEVAEIYPELVVRDKDSQPSGVRYHVLPAMLLNELQRQQREIDELRAQVRALIGGKAAVRE
jgi:Chaperone of endosialidase